MKLGFALATIMALGSAFAADFAPIRGGNVNYRRQRVFDDAAWVWTSVSNNVAFHRFRNNFTSDGEASELYVSADEQYVLMLDGQELSRGPHRGMPSHWYCQRVPLKTTPGSHRLEAVVWTLGTDAPTSQLTLGGGFFLKATGSLDAALTTGKGEWQVAEQHGTEPNGKSYDEAFGSGCEFKVRGTSFLDEMPPTSAWTPAITVMSPAKPGIVGCGVVPRGWCVYESELPELTGRFLRPGDLSRQSKIVIPAHSKHAALYDLENYYCAYPYLKVSGGKGANVRLGFSECLVGEDGEKINRDDRNGRFTQSITDTYATDGRLEATLTVPWWRAGKWCKLEVETGDEPLVINDISLKERRFPITMEGSFVAEGDETLAPIGQMCERGVMMCAHDIMFDCPFYEQQMYGGDILMSFAAMRMMTRDKRLMRQSMALFDHARMPTGLVPMNWPCVSEQRGTTWTLSWVCAVGEMAMWSGEENRGWLLDRLAGLMHTMMAYERIENEAGLLVDPPGWNFLDWSKEWKPFLHTPPNGQPGHGPDACINLLYLQAMERMIELVTAVGKPELAEYWQHKAKRLASGIRATFWENTRGMIADTPEKTSFSEHAVAMSITTECLTAAERDRSFAALEKSTDLARAAYMLHLVFGAYFRYGRGDLFLKKLDQWRYYVKLGLRCPLESPTFQRSDCHAFAATPLCHYHSGLAGVRPASPFFHTVRVAPAPGGLKSIRAKTPHPQGLVETDLAFDDKDGVSGTVTLPKGITGEFVWRGHHQQLKSGINHIN